MKRTIAVLFIILVIAAVVGLNCNAPKTESMLTGRDVVGTLYAVGDTSGLVTYDTLCDVQGPGILRKVTFANANAAVDCTVKVYINGNLIGTVTEETNEATTQYIVLNDVPSATGADTYIAALDSTEVSGNEECNIPFTGSMKITYRTETATNISRVNAIYERFN